MRLAVGGQDERGIQKGRNPGGRHGKTEVHRSPDQGRAGDTYDPA